MSRMKYQPLTFTECPDLSELQTTLSLYPVLTDPPEIRVVQYSCLCHFFWQIRHPQNAEVEALSFYSFYNSEQVFSLWRWLFQLTFENQFELLRLEEDLRDLVYWGCQLLPEDQVKLWIRLQDNPAGYENGEKHLSIRNALVLHCRRKDLIQTLSQTLHKMFTQPAGYNWGFVDGDPAEKLLDLTVAEWPWELFLKWYQERQERSASQVLAAVIKSLMKGLERSQLFQKVRDSVDRLAFELAWANTLRQFLELLLHYHTEPLQHQPLAEHIRTYDRESLAIVDFLDDTPAAWNNGELFGNFNEAEYRPYSEPENREALTIQHRANLDNWRQQFELGLHQLIPDAMEETSIGRVCFEKEVKHA